MAATDRMQTVSADVDETARRREPPSLSPRTDRLVESPNSCERNQNDNKCHVRIVNPDQIRRTLDDRGSETFTDTCNVLPMNRSSPTGVRGHYIEAGDTSDFDFNDLRARVCAMMVVHVAVR
jgi:hypothetical protein